MTTTLGARVVIAGVASGVGKTTIATGLMAALRAGGLAVANEKLASGDYQLLILDELTYAIKYGWIHVDDVVDGITARSPKTNVVITGRDAPQELIDLANTVTEMRKIKHAYDQDITAMKGIEY